MPLGAPKLPRFSAAAQPALPSTTRYVHGAFPDGGCDVDDTSGAAGPPVREDLRLVGAVQTGAAQRLGTGTQPLQGVTPRAADVAGWPGRRRGTRSRHGT